MGLFDKLRRGTHVFGPDNKDLGTIERWDDKSVYIGGRAYERSMFDRFDNDRLYFSKSGYQSFSGAGRGTGASAVGGNLTDEEMRVQVMEERLNVEKRSGQIGEVQIRKDVETEQVNIPVELRHEEVHVNRVDTPDRPVRPGDAPDAFKAGTIRVPIRGEEAVARKEAFVTGEVVIDRDVVTERETISDTVRRETVDVDEDFTRNRDDFRQHFEGRRANLGGTAADTRRYDDAEPNYKRGFTAARDERYAGRKFEDVEPDLRREHGSKAGDSWEELRDEVREGWERARRR